jgi:hypothetical protein
VRNRTFQRWHQELRANGPCRTNNERAFTWHSVHVYACTAVTRITFDIDIRNATETSPWYERCRHEIIREVKRFIINCVIVWEWTLTIGCFQLLWRLGTKRNGVTRKPSHWILTQDKCYRRVEVQTGSRRAAHCELFWTAIAVQFVRVQLKGDGTRWRTGGEVKGKLANVVGSQYSSHYLGTRCIQHYYRRCVHLACQQSTELRPRRFKWTRPFHRKTKSGFCACAITFQTQCTSVYAPVPLVGGRLSGVLQARWHAASKVPPVTSHHVCSNACRDIFCTSKFVHIFWDTLHVMPSQHKLFDRACTCAVHHKEAKVWNQ